ncbi:MAG: S8 family serine peptidase [Candidatus Electryonea clarkiae]|nr:S8 family serine peptidase [Candidatus Electryonea clarkiae]MDP8287807.1 S8 family serine peptidase [Candidatus Electryonea clarkiae]
MFKKVTVFTIILVLSIAITIPSFAEQNRISSPLLEKMTDIENGELLPVVVLMSERPDINVLRDLVKNLPRKERAKVVLDEIVSLAEETQYELLEYLEFESDRGSVQDIHSLRTINGIAIKAAANVIHNISRRDDIDRVIYDPPRNVFFDEMGTQAGNELDELTWGVEQINAEAVWEAGYTGEGVLVAVLDTGVNYNHPDLEDHLWDGGDDYPNHGYDFGTDDNDPLDTYGHGTHVAGTVCGDGENGTETGVAPDATLMCVKVGYGTGQEDQASVWEAHEFCIEQEVDITTMSMGWMPAWDPDRTAWRETYDVLDAAGIVNFVAAGNERGILPPNSCRTPGNVPSPWEHPDEEGEGERGGVISVGATDSEDNFATFSSRGPCEWEDVDDYNDWPLGDDDPGLLRPDIAAPGVDVVSTSMALGYTSMSGTSMATPHMAGVACLMLSKNPELLPEEIDELLQETALDLGDDGKDNDYGAGRVRADVVVENVDEPGEPDATVSGVITNAFTEDPVENAVIRIGGARDTTDIDGNYELIDVHSGERTIRIQREHYYSYREDVVIESGDNEFDIEITPLAILSGIINDSETEVPLEGAIISWGSHIDTTDVDGNYSLIDIRADTNTLFIELEGYFDYTDTVFVIEDGDSEADFAIDILSAPLTGIVTDEFTEEFVSGANIECFDSETGELYREILTDDLGYYEAPALHDLVIYRLVVTREGYAPSDTENVLIRWNRENVHDVEITPIYERSIEALQTTQALGTWITTTGIVTQGTNVTDVEHTNFYIQDGEFGIQVWDEDPWDIEDNIIRGDEVIITGYLVEEEEITRITNFDYELVSTRNPLPPPLEGSTFEISRDGEMEGSWAQICGQINRTPPNHGSYSLTVDDGSGQCYVSIREPASLDLSDFEIYDWGVFTGIIEMTRQGVRIIPNMQQDIELVEINSPTDLTAETAEQVDPVGLEVILTWNHENNLDEFRNYSIFRDGEYIDQSRDTTWSEVLEEPDDWGEYSWTYYVTAVYYEGESEISNEVEVSWDYNFVYKDPFAGIPTEWSLAAVYPNPFNPVVSVVVGLPEIGKLAVRVFNINGREYAEIAHDNFSAGYHEFSFNAEQLSSGIYFIHASVPGKLDEIRKVVLLK